MSSPQKLTLGLALALILASTWKQRTLQDIWATLSSGTYNGTNLVTDFKALGPDILFLIVIAWLAGLSDAAGKVTSVFLVALWLAFLMGKSATPSQILANTGGGHLFAV